MIDLKNITYLLIHSEYNYILIGLIVIIGILSGKIVVIITQQIQFRETFVRLKENTIKIYKHFDKQAHSQFLSRIQKASNESTFKIKLNFFEKMDLKLIERSNIRSYIPLLNIYVLLFMIGLIFFFAISPIYSIFNSWKTAIVLSILVSLTPAILLETLTIFNISQMRRLTADFLTFLLSWLEVKNDLKFALKHVKDDMGGPFRSYLNDTVTQIENGVEPERAFDILSYKINTEQFYMINHNFKSAFKNGGDLLELVKVLSEEAHLIENEFSTRIVDTFSTRLLLNVLLFGAIFFLFIVVLVSPTYNAIYTETPGGKNVLFVATSIFVFGFLLNIKSEKYDY